MNFYMTAGNLTTLSCEMPLPALLAAIQHLVKSGAGEVLRSDIGQHRCRSIRVARRESGNCRSGLARPPVLSGVSSSERELSNTDVHSRDLPYTDGPVPVLLLDFSIEFRDQCR